MATDSGSLSALIFRFFSFFLSKPLILLFPLIFILIATYSSTLATTTYRLTASNSLSSPNSNGIQDHTIFRVINVRRKARQVNWRLDIVSSEGQTVRSYHADRRLIRPLRSIRNLYLPDSMSVRPVQLFEKLLWDGRNDNGVIVNDGYYTAILTIYRDGGGLQNAEVPLEVRTASPALEVSPVESILLRRRDAEGNALQPDGEFRIRQTGTRAIGMVYESEITDVSGNVIERRRWEDSFPERVYWNGRKENGEPADYGNYIYRLKAKDSAGNRNEVSFQYLHITEEDTNLDVWPRNFYYSPRASGSLIFDLKRIGSYQDWNPGGRRRGESYYLEIRDSSGIVYTESGETSDTISWDGNDTSGRTVSDGIYTVQIQVGGGQEVSPPVSFIVDSTPPRIGLKVSSSYFHPDESLETEYLEINTSFRDKSEISDWLISIYNNPDIASISETHRTFQGKGRLPPTILWNGKGDQGQRPESLENFTIIFEACDQAGNCSELMPEDVQTGILWRPAEQAQPELYTRIPNQRYFNAFDELTDEGKEALSNVVRSLERYRRYRILAGYHTASSGREEQNLTRSERRAEAIYSYLLDSGIARERLRYRGYGETELLWPGRGNYESYRNERIELELTPDRHR